MKTAEQILKKAIEKKQEKAPQDVEEPNSIAHQLLKNALERKKIETGLIPTENILDNSYTSGRSFIDDAWGALKYSTLSGIAGLLGFLGNLDPNEYRRIKMTEKDPERAEVASDAAAEAAQKLRNMGYAGYAGFLEKYVQKDEDNVIEKKAKDLREAAVEALPEDFETDIINSFAEGDIEGGLWKMAMVTIMAAPQLLFTAGTTVAGFPNIGLTVIGSSSAGSTYMELENREDLTETQKRSVATLYGLFEAIAEKFGSSRLLNEIINNPTAKKSVTRGLVKMVYKFLGTEVGEETATSIAQDGTAMIFGVDPEMDGKKMLYNAGNASLGAVIPGLGFTGIAKLTLPSDTSTDSDAEIEAEATPEKSPAEVIIEKFNYNQSKQTDIQKMIDIAGQFARDLDIAPDIIAALMKIESDFTDTSHHLSSAQGPLQITKAAIEDLEEHGILLVNPLDTLEGKIEAGMKYFKLLRDHYGFEGDELIAAYYAGPTYVREYGITDVVFEDQISPKEYVERFKEAHSTLIGMERTDTETETVEEPEVEQEEPEVEQEEPEVEQEEPEVEQEEPATEEGQELKLKFGLDDPAMVQRALRALDYDVEESGILDSDTLLSLSQFQQAHGIEWNTDTANPDNLLNEEFKQAIKDALAKKRADKSNSGIDSQEVLYEIEAQEGEAQVVNDTTQETTQDTNQVMTTPRPGDYWEQYGKYLKDITGRMEVEQAPEARMPAEIEVEGRDTIEFEQSVDAYIKSMMGWYINDAMSTNVHEAHYLENINKPAEGGSINTTKVLADPKVLKSIELTGKAIEGELDRITHDEIREAYQSEFKENANINETLRKLGIMKEAAEKLAEALQGAPELMYGMRKAITANGNAIKQLATEINAKSGDVSDVTWAKFAKLIQLQKALTGPVKNIWRKVGQVMNQGNMYVDGKGMNLLDIHPEQIKLTADGQTVLQEFIKDAGGKQELSKLAEQLAKEETDLARISEISREAFGDRALRSLAELRSTNLLRYIATYLRNISSQTLNMVAEWAANFNAATINKFRGRPATPQTLEQANNEVGMTYTEAVKRLVYDLVGIVESFTKPIVTLQEAGELMYDRQYSKFQLMWLAAFQPVKFEKIFEAAQIDNRIRIELGRRHKALSADNLFPNINENSTIGELLATGMNNLGALLRLSSYGGLQLGDKPFTYAGYSSELAGQLHLLSQTEKLQNMTRAERKQYLKTMKDACLAIRKLHTLNSQIGEKAMRIVASQEGEVDINEVRRQLENELTNGVLENLTPEMLEDAIKMDKTAMEHAQYMTWKDPFEKDEWLGKVENFANSHPGLRVIFPFIHTPLKIVQKGWNWGNPLARETRQKLSGARGKRAQTQALAQLATTAMLTIWGLMLAAINQATPPAREESERERMELAKVPPHSIKINDKWVDYSQWIPFPGFFLALATSTYRSMYETQQMEDSTRGEKALKIVSDTMFAVYQSLRDLTMLRSLDRLQDAMSGIAPEDYLIDFLKTLNPDYTFKRNRTNYKWWGLNPFYEEYWKENGIVQRDIFGKPITNYKVFMGARAEEATDSPIRQELYDLGITLPKMRSTFNNIKLTDEQYNALLKYMDEEIKAEERLNELVTSESYKNLSTERKIEEIRNLWQEIKVATKEILYENEEYVKEYLHFQKEKELAASTDDGYMYDMFHSLEDSKKYNKSPWEFLKQFIEGGE